MTKMNFIQASTGARGSGRTPFKVRPFNFETGKDHRLVIPLRTNEDGSQEIVIFGETIHSFNGKGFVQIPKAKGGTYTTFTYRCTHPYSQQSQKDAVHLAEKEEFCPLCEMHNYENNELYAKMNEEYGDHGFKDLTTKEQRAFYEENALRVEPSYRRKTSDDGEDESYLTTEMYMLALEIITEEKTREIKNKKTGKTRDIVDNVPVVEDGKVKYEPVLYKVTMKRLNELKNAVDDKIEDGTIALENVHSFIENEGTDNEEEISIGWVDFQLSYPDVSSRMDSARDMKLSAVNDDKSAVVKNEGFVEEVEAQMDKYYDDAYKMYKAFYKHLQMRSREDILEMFIPEVKGVFDQLREEYRTEKDEEFEKSVFENVLSTGDGSSKADDSEDESDDTETDADADGEDVVVDEEVDVEEEEEEKPEKKATKKKATTKKDTKKKDTKKTETKKKDTKKKETKKEEEPIEDVSDEDLDEDLDIDPDDLFND